MQKIIIRNNCPLCMSSSVKKIYENIADYAFLNSNLRSDYYKCMSCQSLFPEVIPSSNYLKEIYSEYYTKNGGNILDNSRAEIDLSVKNTIDKLLRKKNLFYRFIIYILKHEFPLKIINLRNKKKCNVIDVGCGNGRTLSILKDWGYSVIGLDYNDVSDVYSNISNNYISGDINITMNELNNKFDIVISSHVIEHVYDPYKFLCSLLNLLNAEGRLYLSYPNQRSILRLIFKKYWFGLDYPRHLSLPSIEYIRSIVPSNYIVVEHKSRLMTFWVSYFSKYHKSNIYTRLFGKFIEYISFIIPKKYQDFIELEIYKK